MRISFVLPQVSLTGGIRVAAIHAHRLQEKGHEVVLVSLPPPVWPIKRHIGQLLRTGSWRRPGPGRSHLEDFSLDHRVLDRHRPVEAGDLPDADVVIATWWETAEWVAALPPEKGVKVHFVQGHEVFDPLPVDRVRAAYRLPLHKITISRWLVDVLRAEYGTQVVSLVPNGVDTAHFNAPPRPRGTPLTVGMIYNRHPIKGADVMVSALKQVKQAIPDLHGVAFGSSEPVDEIPLPSWMTFHLQPPQSQIPQLYGACDAWLIGSRTEGFCLPMLEAMACRCPVVATRVGGTVDVIRDGENGYLVDIDDEDAMVDRLVRVLELDDAGWKRMSDAAYATAAGYTWDDAADRFEQALRSAVQGETGKP